MRVKNVCVCFPRCTLAAVESDPSLSCLFPLRPPLFLAPFFASMGMYALCVRACVRVCVRACLRAYIACTGIDEALLMNPNHFNEVDLMAHHERSLHAKRLDKLS